MPPAAGKDCLETEPLVSNLHRGLQLAPYGAPLDREDDYAAVPQQSA